jgi:hypothetical protein
VLQDLENPTLRGLHRRARALDQAFAGLVEGLASRHLAWSPAPGSWGIAECLEHLAVTSEHCEEELARALERSRPRPQGSGASRPGPLGRWLIDAAGPRAGARPLRCPLELRPGWTAPERALARFRAAHGRLMAQLEAADGLDLEGVRVRAPAHPLLRVRLGEAFELAVAHAERHLAQARRVRLDPRFPHVA